MTRGFGSVVLCVTLGSGLLACSSSGDTGSSKNALELVPLNNDVSGWTVDESQNQSPGKRAMIGTTEQEVGNLIDGQGHAFFKDYTPKQFAWQNYLNSTLPAAPPPDGAGIMLYVLQMRSAADASGLYAALANLSDYAARTADGWKPTTPALGAESRIQDTNSEWWINFHQDVFYIEVKLFPSVGPAPDFAPGNTETKDEAVRFARSIASKI